MTKQIVMGSQDSGSSTDASFNPWTDPGSDEDFFENSEVLSLRQRATEYALAGVPVHLSGAAGLGKTSLAFRIAKELERPVSIMTGNAWLSSSDFVGGAIGSSSSTVVDRYVQSVRRTEKQSRTDWASSVLSVAMQNGHTLIYDEFTRASPEANSTILSVLEEGLLVCTDPAGPQHTIHAHPCFRIILTSNPHDYVGVNHAPDAFLDRVVTIQMPEYSDETMVHILEKRTGLALPKCEQLVSLHAMLRQQASSPKFSMLRGVLLAGRIAAFRARNKDLQDEDIAEITRDIFVGRGVLPHLGEQPDALQQSKVA